MKKRPKRPISPSLRKFPRLRDCEHPVPKLMQTPLQDEFEQAPPPSPPTKKQTTIADWVGMRHDAPKPPDEGYLVVDFFCSVGGVSIAAAELGHKVVLAIDFDETRLNVHRHNHPDTRHECLALGPDAEEDVVQMIKEAVPENQWHRLWLHLSPPCQGQSQLRVMGKKMGMENQLCTKEEFTEHKQLGLSLVEWSLHMVERLDPAQFSIEEVADKQGCVASAMNNYRRRLPKKIDFDTFKMVEYGLPQIRIRIIAGRPATIETLRHDRRLRVSKHVAVKDVLPIPKGATHVQGCLSHKVDPKNVKKCAETGVYTDGFAMFYSVSNPCPTIAARAHTWVCKDFQRIRGLSVEELRVLSGFPAIFEWPENTKKQIMYDGYGNAVPPLFAKKLFTAAAYAAEKWGAES